MATPRTRDHYSRQSLGTPLHGLIKEARVLLVGAGGIGCELLKNLVLAGFGEVHIVDLDTIDLSNLNRQFLFRHEHISKSKALVAKEAAHRFNPAVRLEAHHANIKEPRFNFDWYRGFHIVFNALDNLDARRHVNRMCLAADVPLIESGTQGFNGQVQVIKKGISACYDCSEKVTPTTYPVCTIRSTPSQPIHCIVWAKSYLLNELFGVGEDEAPELDTSEDSENAEEIRKLRHEAQALQEIRNSMGSDDFAQRVFDKVYTTDIERLRSTEELWTYRKRPEALDYATINARVSQDDASIQSVLRADQKAWTLEENMAVFRDSLARLSKRFQHMKDTVPADAAAPTISFDKDDPDCLDFVTASANLRSIVFGIERKSRFDVKQMAGNIIPAIATTNAIMAGLCVLEAYKVLRGDFDTIKEVYLSVSQPDRLLASDSKRGPEPGCPICSVAQTRLLVDMSRATLKDLVEDFLKLQLGYGEEIAIAEAENQLYDVDETENLSKKLSDLGIKDGSFIYVRDEDDEHPDGPRVNLVLSVQASDAAMDDTPIRGLDLPLKTDEPESKAATSPIPRLKKPAPPAAEAQAKVPTTTNGHSNGDASVNGNAVGTQAKKRTATDAFDDVGAAKKSKLAKSHDDDIVEIIDKADDGAIVID